MIYGLYYNTNKIALKSYLTLLCDINTEVIASKVLHNARHLQTITCNTNIHNEILHFFIPYEVASNCKIISRRY